MPRAASSRNMSAGIVGRRNTLQQCVKRRDERTPEKIHQVTTALSDDDEYTLHRVSMKTTNPLVVTVTLNKMRCVMEVDTGASVSIMSEKRFKQLRVVLSQSQAKLFTYTGKQILVLFIGVRVKHNSQVATLPLIVTGGTGPTLLGRNWLSALHLKWSEFYAVHTCNSLQDFQRHTVKYSATNLGP